MKNKDATRTFSDAHEKSVCRECNAIQQPNSGAGMWKKGDCVNNDASILIECKCQMNEKESFSVKKEWLYKNKKEMLAMGLFNHCLAFNFGPDTENFYVIDTKLMKFLIEKLEEENKE